MKSDSGLMKLIWGPALLTLGVTLLRLIGELMDWSPVFFSRVVGGGGAVVGIIWLVPIFGAYFAQRLERSGRGPGSAGRVLGISSLGLLAFAAVVALGFAQRTASGAQFALIAVGSAVGILIAWRGWAELAATLFAYGLAARIPVAVVVLLGVLNDWGTHYDTPPPGLPALDALPR